MRVGYSLGQQWESMLLPGTHSAAEIQHIRVPQSDQFLSGDAAHASATAVDPHTCTLVRGEFRNVRFNFTV